MGVVFHLPVDQYLRANATSIVAEFSNVVHPLHDPVRPTVDGPPTGADAKTVAATAVNVQLDRDACLP
jgi:hypothetical protein